MTTMLEVKDLEVAYGKILAVKKISFSVDEGQVVTLIGTNGAGKTTTLRTISGLLRPSSGEIPFQGKRIDKTPPHQIVSLGLAHSPEGRRIFPRMSVEENLLLGAFARKDACRDPAGTCRRRTTCSRSSGSGASSRPARSPAVSSRCSRWAGR